MPYEDRKKKLTRKERKKIRIQAKKESGGYASRSKKSTASKVGTAFRKLTTGSRYGLKKKGSGADLPTKKTVKTPLKEAGTRTRKFVGEKGGGTKEGAVTDQDAKTNISLAARTIAATKAKGGHDAVKRAKDKGYAEAPEFKENVAKRKAEAYKKGSRTESQIEYDKSIEDRRRTHVRRAGGNIKKGERKFKRERKKEIKEDYRSRK